MTCILLSTTSFISTDIDNSDALVTFLSLLEGQNITKRQTSITDLLTMPIYVKATSRFWLTLSPQPALSVKLHLLVSLKTLITNSSLPILVVQGFLLFFLTLWIREMQFSLC